MSQDGLPREKPTSGFQQRLGLFDATMLVAGTMIGSGIFIVSAGIARDVGSSGWLLAVWVLTGLMTVQPWTGPEDPEPARPYFQHLLRLRPRHRVVLLVAALLERLRRADVADVPVRLSHHHRDGRPDRAYFGRSAWLKRSQRA